MKRHLLPPNPCGLAQCDGPACVDYLRPTHGSVVHRTPACARAVIEANHLIGKDEMTASEVARYLGVTEGRVRQIEIVAKRKVLRVLKEAA